MTIEATPRHDRRTVVVLVGLLAVAVTLQAVRERLAPPRAPTVPSLWLQSPDAARRLMLSFTDLAADVYWIRAITYYGSERKAADSPQRYALLYPLLDLTTSLDPHFDVASRLGAIFLSEGYPGGPGRPDQALALLEKGLRQDPQRWQYRHDMGFVHYWWLQDYAAASRQFELASLLPGAPPWLRTMAGQALTVGGDRDDARRLWTEMYQTSELDWMRRAAKYRLDQFAALDDLDALTAVVARGRAQGIALDWSSLVRAGLLRDIPTDPVGQPYVLDATGVVTLGSASVLAPLPAFENHR